MTVYEENQKAMSEKLAQRLIDIGVFHRGRDEENGTYSINLNDAFYWACSDLEDVKPEQVKEVYDLFVAYGNPGVFYWVLKQRGGDKVEFEDVNRHVEFVRQEEAIKQAVPSSSRRAYHKASYTIGAVAEK